MVDLFRAPVPIPYKTYYGLKISTVKDYYGKNVVYMGYWDKKLATGWSDRPFDVFYQPNPDKSKGHTNYFGFFTDILGRHMMITDAAPCFSEPITVAVKGKELLVSRYRHNFVSSQDKKFSIDGGRSYTRHIGDPEGWEIKKVIVIDDKFYWCNDTNLKLTEIDVSLIENYGFF